MHAPKSNQNAGGVHIMNSAYFDESDMKNEEKESK